MTPKAHNRLALAVAALLLTGFTFASLKVQTERVRWEVAYVGAAYNTAVPEETNLRHCFDIAGYTDVFGAATFRTAGLRCQWGVAGTVSGANGVDVKIVHEDGGIDCQCTLGACDTAANTAMDCDCGAVVELGKTIMPDGGEQGTTQVCVQIDDATDCTANPAAFTCAIDLFR